MRISREQALDCFRSDDLVGIGMEADAVRRRLHPEGVAGYAIGGAVGIGSGDRTLEAIEEMVERGATGVRLAGRIAATGFERLESVIGGLRRRFPAIWIEGLAAPDVVAISGERGSGLRETIARLRGAGLDSISGDGVNLVDGNVEQWAEVHRAAHGLGMPTVASMIFGAGETMERRVGFLEQVRALQAETGGFAAFAPVAAEAPGGRELDGVTAVERLKTLAISRMFLEGIENVQAGWAGQGLKVLQMGLRFGANDVGVVSGEGASEEDVRRVIRDAGFKPAQRDMAYRSMFVN